MLFPVLETKRLMLVQVQPADQQFIYEGLSDKETMPYNGVYYDSFKHAAEQMNWYADMFNNESGMPWKIVEKDTNKNVGVITVYYYKKEHNKAETGFWTMPEFWGKGYVTEALQAVIQYWFTNKNLHRLEAEVETENKASKKVLLKNGFVLEGTKRDCEMKFGRYISLDMFALLK